MDTVAAAITVSPVAAATVNLAEFTSIPPSALVRPENVAATPTIVPLTSKLPFTSIKVELSSISSEPMEIASASLTLPIVPASGITILPPVVIVPAPVYVPLAFMFALTSSKVAFNSISSVALISRIVPLAPCIN